MIRPLWTRRDRDRSDADRSTVLRAKAVVMDLLADHDSTVKVAARETACELRCAALVIEALSGMAAGVPGWHPEPAAMPRHDPRNTEEV